MEHAGIKVELKGVIELYYERGHLYEFTSIPLILAPAGAVHGSSSFDFEFAGTEDKPYETYNGVFVSVFVCAFDVT